MSIWRCLALLLALAMPTAALAQNSDTSKEARDSIYRLIWQDRAAGYCGLFAPPFLTGCRYFGPAWLAPPRQSRPMRADRPGPPRHGRKRNRPAPAHLSRRRPPVLNLR